MLDLYLSSTLLISNSRYSLDLNQQSVMFHVFQQLFSNHVIYPWTALTSHFHPVSNFLHFQNAFQKQEKMNTAL